MSVPWLPGEGVALLAEDAVVVARDRPPIFAPQDGQAASPDPPNAIPSKIRPRTPGIRAIPAVIAPSTIDVKRSTESAIAARPPTA